MVFLIILIASLLFQFVLPWWIIGPIAFLAAFLKAVSGKDAFWSGFGAIFLLWIAVGLFKTIPNDNILANRVGQLFGFPDLPFNWVLLLVITGIVGGLVSGISALAGFYCKQATTK